MEYETVFGAIAVLVYKDWDGQVWVLIKERIDPGAEGMDHGKWETVAETMKPGIDKNGADAARRGCREELGLPELEVLLLGEGGFSRGPWYCGGFGSVCRPYSTFHKIVGKRSLNAEIYVARLDHKTEPQPTKESGRFRWLPIEDAMIALQTPEMFSFTYAALWQVCDDIAKGNLKL